MRRLAPRVLVTALIFSLSTIVWADRSHPPAVAAVRTTTAKIDFEIDRNQCKDGNGICELDVFLVAKNLADDKVTWKSELYKRELKPGVETDVQEILPKSLKLRKTHVQARDERNKLYVVDLSSGALVHPKKPMVYSADQ